MRDHRSHRTIHAVASNTHTTLYKSLKWLPLLLFPITHATTSLSDRNVLYLLYDSTQGESWTRSTHWRDPTKSLCEFEGVTCQQDSEFVTHLELSRNNLQGEVPFTRILQMPHLKVLKLDGNPITIPNDVILGDVADENLSGINSQLEVLDLSHVNVGSWSGLFGGEDSSSLSVTMSRLQDAYLSECNLHGPLPHQLFQSTLLERLVLESNEITGPLSSEIGNWRELRYLSLTNNELTGMIPSSISELSKLKYLYLRDNRFTNDLPNSLQELELIEVIDISRQKTLTNPGITGNLPGFTGLKFLRRLDLSENSIQGPISVDFLKDVDPNVFEYVRLGSNQLTGMLHAEPFWKLPVDAVFLEGNRIDDIDPALCDSNRGGVVGLFGCDAILCAPGTYHRTGRQETEQEDCLVCPAAQFYGATNCVFGDETDAPTEPPVVNAPPVVLSPREILEKLYVAAGGDGWTDRDGWMGTDGVCTWFGIQCSDDDDESSITDIFLSGNNLIGSIPSEVFTLVNLAKLSLSKNSVKISFEGIEHAQSLLSLDLSSVGLYSIEGISKATKLTDLRLEMNSLEGTVPEELFDLTELEQLRIDYNSFTGEIPNQIGDLKQLKVLSMDSNAFSGPLPSALANLQDLTSLRIKSNRLSGPLPSFLEEMNSLTFLDLSNQTLTGPLLEFSNHIHLKRLDLSSNQLTGTIPTPFLSGVDRATFEFANLSSNHLTNQIPSTLAGLHDIYLEDNLITSIHPDVCDPSLGGAVAQFGCDAILCDIGTYNVLGRQQSFDTVCVECETALFMGSTVCPEEGRTVVPTVPVTSAVMPVEDMTEREILERFYAACGGDDWSEKGKWMEEGSDHCKWEGIRCTPDGKVLEVTLRSNNLTGDLPKELFRLEFLETLNLDGNSVSVDFDGIEHATSLKSVDLSHTDVRSTQGIGKATSVTDLYLTSNAIKGQFPTELLQLTNLKRLSLALNQLTGTIPPQIYTLQNLEFLSLHSNELTGNLPHELGQMSKLLFLLLQDNHFSGEIPQEISQLTSIWFLDLSNQKDTENTGLTGLLPSFSTLKELRRLDVKNNALTGSIPADLLQNVNPDDFEYVDLSSNNLSGEIPPILGTLPLDGIYLADNRITGIAISLCDDASDFEGVVGQYGCDAILCAPGTYNAVGRQESADTECRTCPDPGDMLYYGSIRCATYETPAPTPPPVEVSPITVPSSEKEILEKLYTTCGGDRWRRKDEWMDPMTTHCQWFGVRCVETEQGLSVVSIMLSSNNLIGTPPSELFQLENLDTLVLDNNMILFDFSDIERATNLKTLDLSSTGITSLNGIGDGRSLVELHLDDGNLNGAIPDDIFDLVNLEQLSLDENEFTGSLPVGVGRLTKLKLLTCASNSLNGPLPAKIGNLKELVTLHLQDNRLDGNLPSELATLPNLSFLDLSHQTINGGGLTGPLPNFAKLRDIRNFDLSFNQLTGTIPPTFLENANPEFLEVVDLSSNKLNGEVPNEIARLGILQLQDNEFTGISQDVCALSEYGCNGILCPAQTCNCIGRQESSTTPCVDCPSAQFLGSSQCEDATESYTASDTSPEIHEHKVYMTERQILEKLYDKCKGYYWLNSDNWKTDESICTWEGIECTEGMESVEEINLGSNNLNCVPPFEILHLPNLRVLSLYSNPLDEFSFDGIEYAAKLEELYLDATGISTVGGIEKAPKLEKLNLRFNDLTGHFPQELMEIPTLTYLSVADNELTGTLPENFSKLTKLEALLLGSNRFTGELTNVRLPSSMRLLDLSQNELAGSIPPTFLQSMSSSEVLDVDLSDNLLSGVVPASLQLFDALNIYLQTNFISGIEEGLCEKSYWNDGDVGKYGCDGLLCPIGYWAPEGRQSSEEERCLPCPSASYHGATECADQSGRSDGERWSVSGWVLGWMVGLSIALMVGA